MATPGYLYVLINPSMEGLVKVGRTEREPEDRVKELSSATGIPTPFQLAYDAHFECCVQAEAQVHNELEERGFRVSANREFFNAPLNEVIKVVVARQWRAQVSGSSATAGPVNGRQSSQVPIDMEIFDLGEQYFHGIGEVARDYKKALNLFRRAADAGSAEAWSRLASMYQFGLGTKSDLNKAIEFYKKAISGGFEPALLELAGLFWSGSHLGKEKARIGDSYLERYIHSRTFTSIAEKDRTDLIIAWGNSRVLEALSIETCMLLSGSKQAVISKTTDKCTTEWCALMNDTNQSYAISYIIERIGDISSMASKGTGRHNRHEAILYQSQLAESLKDIEALATTQIQEYWSKVEYIEKFIPGESTTPLRKEDLLELIPAYVEGLILFEKLNQAETKRIIPAPHEFALERVSDSCMNS